MGTFKMGAFKNGLAVALVCACVALIFLGALPMAKAQNTSYGSGAQMIETQCHVCNGTGRMRCNACGGDGWVSGPNPYSDDPNLSARRRCGVCGGTGQITCMYCGGRGTTMVRVGSGSSRSVDSLRSGTGRTSTRSTGNQSVADAVEVDLARLRGSYGGIAVNMQTRQKFRVHFSITSAGIGGTFFLSNGSECAFNGACVGGGRVGYMTASGFDDGSGRIMVKQGRLYGLFRFTGYRGSWTVGMIVRRDGP